MFLFVFWVCLCSAVGLDTEDMHTHRLAPGNKGDFWSKCALEEGSKVCLVESGVREGRKDT